MKGVQCYELFGAIALKIHTFSFFHFHAMFTLCDVYVLVCLCALDTLSQMYSQELLHVYCFCCCYSACKSTYNCNI